MISRLGASTFQFSLIRHELMVFKLSLLHFAIIVNKLAFAMIIAILPHSDIVLTSIIKISSKSIRWVIQPYAFVNELIFPHISANAVSRSCSFFEETDWVAIIVTHLFELKIFGIDGKVIKIAILDDDFNWDGTQFVPNGWRFVTSIAWKACQNRL